MKWFSLLGALIVGVSTMVTPIRAQEEIFLPDESLPIDGSVVVLNGRKCIDPNGLQVTARCPVVTAQEAAACPTGPCFSWGRGCEHISGNNKESQRIQMNSGEFTNRMDVGNGGIGKQVDLAEKIVCYKERQCKCEFDGYGNYACQEGVLKEYGIARYEVTNRDCPIAVITP